MGSLPNDTWRLRRIHKNEECVKGILITDDNVLLAVTAERRWEGNKANVSCIPIGIYICKRVTSPRFGSAFEVVGVKNRTNILFHVGNFPRDDSRGCILIGTSFTHMGVIESRSAFATFMKKLEGQNGFKLEITECY